MVARRKARGVTSKAQWAWMFAARKAFAHRWAEKIERTRGVKTGYRSLPARKGVRKRA